VVKGTRELRSDWLLSSEYQQNQLEKRIVADFFYNNSMLAILMAPILLPSHCYNRIAVIYYKI
jgi:hypothetical protein